MGTSEIPFLFSSLTRASVLIAQVWACPPPCPSGCRVVWVGLIYLPLLPHGLSCREQILLWGPKFLPLQKLLLDVLLCKETRRDLQ